LNTINQRYQTDNYRIFDPTTTVTTECAFFSSAHRILSKINHMLVGHEINFNKCKRINVIQSMSSFHNKIKLKVRERNLGNSQTWK
jgi:hypothetical protein